MFFKKTIISIAFSTIVAPGVIQMTNDTNQAIIINNVHKIINSAPNGGVPSGWTLYEQTDYNLKFMVTLGNSTYNGFPGFINQIIPDGRGIRYYFFQWLNDNEFNTSWKSKFPNLNEYTRSGFWHWPFTSSQRFETIMHSFGPWYDTTSETAKEMIFDISDSFLTGAENAYKNTTNPAGIEFNFSFHCTNDSGFYSHFTDLGHSYKVLT